MTGPADAASLLGWARTETWAMEPRALEAMTASLVALSRGQSGEIEAARHGRPVSRSEERAEAAIAVLRVFGPIGYRPSLFSEIFGGTTIKELTRDLQAAMAEPRVKSIFMPIASGGGTVTGVPEFAAALRTARQSKPIIALVDARAGSAAYWIASSASEIIAVPSGEVGSIGVFALHLDFSEELKQAGIKPTFVTSTPEKTEGSGLEPLSADARADMQRNVDRVYRAFLADVALGRGINVETVKANFGRGRMFDAARARAAGMVDRVATFDEALARVTSARPGGPVVSLTPARPVTSGARRRRLALLRLE